MVLTARLRAGLALAWSLILVPAAFGQVTSKHADAKPPDDPNPLRELTVSPADSPIPALKYRLIPRISDLNPGDAAPLYLRIRHELNTEAFKKVDGLMDAVDKPLAEFPRDEAREVVESFGGRFQQIEFGARRQTCDWAFSLPEQRREVINMLLPDTQEMRRWARLLALKIKLEVAEGKTDEAIRTLETTIAFGRHVGDHPFLIGNLVGVAIESMTLRRMEELIEQPGSPNLYWALSDLPRPLIDMRRALSEEERVGENMVPELNETNGPHSAAEWSVLVSKMHANMAGLTRFMADNELTPAVRDLKSRDAIAYRNAALPEAKAYLRSRKGLTDDQIQVMTDDQLVATFVAGRYREIRDDLFKNSNLPFPEALTYSRKAEEELKPLKDGPLAIFAWIFPAVIQARIASARLDRQVAAYRVLEALRMYAARHDGGLPQSLADVTEAPVPIDPAAGKPFQYQLDGKAAVLSTPLIDNQPRSGIHWRISVR